MEQIGVYLYGFVPDGAVLDLSGIEGVEGLRPIRSVEVGGVTAVVGEVPLRAFEAAMSGGVDGGPDPSWVVPRALRHEVVLDAVLARSPVLPVRFGALFSSREALEALAIEHRGAIGRFFESVGDRLEWALRGYYDPTRASDLLLESDPELSRRRLALPESPGARYFQEKKLREEARREARLSAAHAAEAVRAALRSITDDARSLPLRGAEGPDREMILHETFLMSPERAAEALALIGSAAAARVEGLLSLEPSGPWPPFHFCPELGGPSA
jgi:Gas vesicle synthesis protein GvpL/GvpF